MKIFRAWYHLIIILLIWGIFAVPYVVKNRTTFPSTYQVNHFPPWSSVEKYWGPVKNGAMPDIVDQIYPWRYFSISELKNGRVPLWNPNNFSGNPNIGNFQSAVFFPLNFLTINPVIKTVTAELSAGRSLMANNESPNKSLLNANI